MSDTEFNLNAFTPKRLGRIPQRFSNDNPYESATWSVDLSDPADVAPVLLPAYGDMTPLQQARKDIASGHSVTTTDGTVFYVKYRQISESPWISTYDIMRLGSADSAPTRVFNQTRQIESMTAWRNGAVLRYNEQNSNVTLAFVGQDVTSEVSELPVLASFAPVVNGNSRSQRFQLIGPVVADGQDSTTADFFVAHFKQLQRISDHTGVQGAVSVKTEATEVNAPGGGAYTGNTGVFTHSTQSGADSAHVLGPLILIKNVYNYWVYDPATKEAWPWGAPDVRSTDSFTFGSQTIAGGNGNTTWVAHSSNFIMHVSLYSLRQGVNPVVLVPSGVTYGQSSPSLNIKHDMGFFFTASKTCWVKELSSAGSILCGNSPSVTNVQEYSFPAATRYRINEVEVIDAASGLLAVRAELNNMGSGIKSRVFLLDVEE